MSFRSQKDIDRLRKIGRVVAQTLQHMGTLLEPGITTLELDQAGRKKLESYGARSAPELVYRFPGATCISINNEVAHGIPSSRRIEAGDLVNIDVSAEMAGFFADTGASFTVPPERVEYRRLCETTRLALARAMKVARAGMPLNGIGKVIQETAEAAGYSVIRNLGSHGVGRGLHEEPNFIPGFFMPNDERLLEKGMAITIEPFLSTGPTEVFDSDDGWTLLVSEGNFAAQYEHTMVITDGEPLVMTLP